MFSAIIKKASKTINTGFPVAAPTDFETTALEPTSSSAKT